MDNQIFFLPINRISISELYKGLKLYKSLNIIKWGRNESKYLQIMILREKVGIRE